MQALQDKTKPKKNRRKKEKKKIGRCILLGIMISLSFKMLPPPFIHSSPRPTSPTQVNMSRHICSIV